MNKMNTGRIKGRWFVFITTVLFACLFASVGSTQVIDFPENYLTMELGENYSVQIDSNNTSAWFSFVPENTGTYLFLAESSPSVSITSYSVFDSKLYYGEYVGSSTETYLNKELTAGKTYYFAVTNSKNSGYVHCMLSVSKEITWEVDEEDVLTISGRGIISDYSSAGSSTGGPWPKTIKHVIIEEGITGIGQAAFYGCGNLQTVSLPDGITCIRANAFNGCTSLVSINIPESVKVIGGQVFRNCSSLESITLPEGISRINTVELFLNCQNLSRITLPSTLTQIGYGMFEYCISLESIVIPDNVTTIASRAFANCSAIKIANFGSNGAKTLGKNYFSFIDPISRWEYIYHDIGDNIGYELISVKGELNKAVIPEGVTSIRAGAFKSTKNTLEYVTLPDGLTSIPDSLFKEFVQLKAITVPGSVSSIGTGAFEKCSSLQSVVLSEGVTHIGYETFKRCGNLENITIPDSLVIIDRSAFFECEKLNSIRFPEGLTTIGSYAFFDCLALTNLSIPDTVTKIGDYAFSFCRNVRSIRMPETITTFGKGVFSWCDSLLGVVIPERVTAIGDETFESCKSLAYISLPNDITSIGESAFYGCEKLESITIPKVVNSIGKSAFFGCEKLTSIEIPDGVQSIGEYTFANCDCLKRIIIPESVTSIGPRAFINDGNLKNLIIPENVTQIGNEAFLRCYNLTKITIPENVSIIGNQAFSSVDEVVFLLSDRDTQITFGENIFQDSVTIYCHIYTAPDSAFSADYNVLYLEQIEMNSIREIIMPADCRMACGDSLQIIPWVFPWDGQEIIWNSSSSEVMTVDNGMAVAISPGIVSINATIGTTTSSMAIEVYLPATKIDLNATELWVQAKENIQLTATLEPEESGAIISWASSNTSLASVSMDGLVSTIKPGDVVITATTEKGISSECLLHLCYPVESIQFDDCSSVNKKVQLKATVTTEDKTYINKLVTFSSSNESVLTIDSFGLVRGISVGTATVTATSYNGKIATITLTVEVPAGIVVANGICGQNLTWELNNYGALTISGNGEMFDYETDKDAPWYEYRNELKSVVVEQGVTSIGKNAFIDWYPLLASVELPEGLESIGEYGFYACQALEGISIPSSVTNIGNWAFAYSGIIDFDLPASVEIIHFRTFYSCRSLKNITLHNGLKAIYSGAFIYCYNMEKIDLPASVETIIDDSFQYCSKLKEINISPENDAFLSIDGIVFSKDLKTLITCPAGYSGQYIVPDNVKVLLQDSFRTCDKLTRIVIHASVTDIKQYVFDGCTSLGYIWYKGTEEQWNNVLKGTDWNKGTPAEQIIEFGADAPEHNTVIIPAVEPTSTESGLTEGIICSRCGETIVPQVEIPKLSELKVLYLPNGLKTIEQESFANLPCQAVIIPEHCTKITERAFANCKNLIYVKISSADTVIEPDAFEGCEHVFIYHAHEALDEH